MAGRGDICRDVGLFHAGRDEAAMDGAALWLRDNQKRLGVRPANALERARWGSASTPRTSG
eukprot:7100423-Alexandrium_andersonii.AAC.1